MQEGLEDGTEAALINLDQSKSFNRVDHRFLSTVLETAGFKLEFRKWISMIYHDPRYKQIAGAKINFDKSEGLRLCAWRDDIPLPGPFYRGEGPLCILVI